MRSGRQGRDCQTDYRHDAQARCPGLQRSANNADSEWLPTDAVPRRRSQLGNGIHVAHQRPGSMMAPLREIGRTGIMVTPIAMGCWPIAGVTSIDVTEANSLATLQAAVDHGINFFDTAYCYGYEGESEKLIAKALGSRRDQIVIAS